MPIPKPGESLKYSTHVEGLFALIEDIAHYQKPNKDEREFSIYESTRFGHEEEVKRILSIGNINVNERNMKINGRTVLHEAASYGHLPLVHMLLECKCIDVNRQSYLGKETALHLAVSSNHRRVVFALLNHGADPNIKNKYGATPLCYANKKSIACLLCAYGASTTMKDINHRTPLDIILARGHDRSGNLLEYLMQTNNDQLKESIQTEIQANREQKRKLAMIKQLEEDQEEREKQSVLNNKLMEDYSKWRIYSEN